MGAKVKKNKKRSNLFLNLLLFICLAIFIYSSYELYSIYREYQQMDESYESLLEDTVVMPEVQEEQLVLPEVDLMALKKINPEIIAYVHIPNTKISYPITQAKDNDKYLNTDASLKKSRAGSIFVDAHNKGDFSDRNTVLYGHNMKNGSMFKDIQNYCRDTSYVSDHPDVYLYTEKGVFRYHIFCVDTIEATSDAYRINFKSDDDYARYLQKRMSASNAIIEDLPYNLERIITLSTCTNASETGRYIIQAFYQETIQ